MHRQPLSRRILGACALLLLAGSPRAGLTQSEGNPPLRIRIDFPAEDQPLGAASRGLGFVSGRVASAEKIPRIDLVFLLDVSGSTASSSGVDVDGDGKVSGQGFIGRLFGGGGGPNPDSILAAEIAAVRELLGRLDPRSTRTSVVIFSGNPQRNARDALVEVPLTANYRDIERGLEEISLVPPQGGTNIYEGLRVAARELSRSVKARREGVQRYIVLLTDGEPTLPEGEPVASVLRVSRALAKRDIRVLSFAIGPDAVNRPEAPREAALLTDGEYVAVSDIGQLADRLGQIRISEVASFELRNQTNDAAPACMVAAPDGRFFALVPMVDGANRLSLRARSKAGETTETERTLQFTADAPFEPELDTTQRVELGRLRVLCSQNDRRRLELEAQGRDTEKRRRLEIETDEEPR